MANKQYNILVVDDDYKFLSFIIDILISELDKDYVFFTAFDGIDALIKAEKNNINLIVSDTNMPRMNGYKLFQKIREKEYFDKTRFIAMSNDAGLIKRIWNKEYGKSSEEYGERGIDAFIDKFYDIPDKLIDLIKNLTC